MGLPTHNVFLSGSWFGSLEEDSEIFGMVVTKLPAPHCPLSLCCAAAWDSVPAPSSRDALGCIHENQID